MHCVFPLFLASYRLLILALVPILDPLLFSSFGDMATTRLPRRANPLSSPFSSLHSSSCRERTMADALPTFVHHYKMPLAFALLRHPHPLESEAQLRDPVVIQGTRFVSQR